MKEPLFIFASPFLKLTDAVLMQHASFTDPFEAAFVNVLFGGCPPLTSYLPLRRRWDSIFVSLGVPVSACFTPGSLRGGGAVHAYEHGLSIPYFLWRMRIRNQDTLAHYFQEVAAATNLRTLPGASKDKIASLARFFPFIVPHDTSIILHGLSNS